MTVDVMPKLPDIVGLDEIADRLDVSYRTVEKWRYRSARGELPVAFPKEDTVISGTPIWRWGKIEAWARATGRLK